MNIRITLFRYFLFKVFFVSLIFNFSPLQAQDDQGRQIFRVYCASCHAMERDLTGPRMDGVFERIQQSQGFTEEQTHEWLIRWIRNAPAVRGEGDPYAMELRERYGGLMPGFLNLSREETEEVIDYMRNWRDYEEVAVVDGLPADRPDLGISTNLILIILVIVLVLIALVLARVTNLLGKIALEKEGKKIPEEVPFYLNRKFHIAIFLVVFFGIGLFLMDSAINVGLQQNYQPTQPIQFSHKLHAGINEIDCQYCHVGVEEGKQAGVPSVNVCMNCHKYVNIGPSAEFKAQHGLAGPGSDTSEIAKIYAAVGWDPQTQTFDRSKAMPVEWIRVHNLPDHVYFSHAQHVNIGGLDCQTCHGPVEEMDVLYQHEPLSMGWCISCHRETEVRFHDNPYYEHHFQDYHRRLTARELNGITVEMIGGVDCQKCHY